MPKYQLEVDTIESLTISIDSENTLEAVVAMEDTWDQYTDISPRFSNFARLKVKGAFSVTSENNSYKIKSITPIKED